MIEPAYLTAARESYDRVAEDYVRIAPPRFAQDALGRAMLAAFAELVPAQDGRPVADLGCGPGHVTAHLAGLGLPVFGVDLSPRMVEIARRTYPALRFEVGSMTALGAPDGQLAGIVAWWSIFHLPPEVLPAVFAGFRRALAPAASCCWASTSATSACAPSGRTGIPSPTRRTCWPPTASPSCCARPAWSSPPGSSRNPTSG